MSYPVRSPKVAPTTISLDADAKLVLMRYTPTEKSYGSFLSRLLLEHQARMEERATHDSDYAALQRIYNLPVHVERAMAREGVTVEE